MIRLGRTFGKILDSFRKGQPRRQEEIRTEKSFALQAKLTLEQRESLFQMRQSRGYSTLLDVIEMACIERETQLINVPVTSPDEVIAEHRMTKAFWQIFIALQRKVEYECNEYIGIKEAEAKDEQEPDEDEQLASV